MEYIFKELDKMSIIPDKIEEIRKKDGIYLYRIYKKDRSYVIKFFDHPDSIREIQYYDLLKRFNVPTLELFGKTERAILMEDMDSSQRWRLGTAADLEDLSVAEALAVWYTTLHNASNHILKERSDWYSEYGLITLENLKIVAVRTNTASLRIWNTLSENLPKLYRIIESLTPVVNYNDFYYTNLAVSRNKKEALMFDYNFMGKGYRAADLRNVCWSLDKNAAQVFLSCYGSIPEYEYFVDDVVSVLTTLILASKCPEMTAWAQNALMTLQSGKLEANLHDLLIG